jgi:predicted nucleotidyltransferase
MLPLIESKRAEIAELCRRHHVRRLEVFGSAARAEDFDPARSDMDFLVEFDPAARVGLFDTYFPFKEALETLLGRPVDLVEDGAVENPYLRASIERSREPVYGP